MKTALLIFFLLNADAFQNQFQRGVTAFESGDYAAAEQAWRQLEVEGVANPALFHNLGNLALRRGKMGEAVGYYEKALRLDPGLENARANLELALRETRRALARPQPRPWEESLLFWHDNWSYGQVRFMAVFFWLLAWVLLAFRQWKPVRFLRRGAVMAFLLAALFGVSAWAKAHPPLMAVAIAETVPARYGPAEADTVRFELFEGDRVAVEDRGDGWARVRTAGGERGWVRAGQVMFIGSPGEYYPIQREEGRPDAG